MTAAAAPRVTVHVEVDGGFAAVPGLNRSFDADTDRLGDTAARTLRTLLAGSDFFAQPARLGAPARGAADLRTYTITVTSQARSHTVQAVDPIPDEGLARLVHFVTAAP